MRFLLLFVCCLKYPYNCFSSYSCFPVIVVLLILELFLAFLCSFKVVFDSSYQYIDAIFNADESSSSFFFFFFFLTHIVGQLSNVRSYTSSLVFLFSGPFVEVLPSSTLRMVLRILQEGPPRCLSLLMRFL